MSRKVLLLEEDATSAAKLQAELAELGCEVTLISDSDTFGGGRVLASIAAEPFDLILLSVDAPLMNGLGICERVKRDPRGRSVPVLLMTADVKALVARDPSTRADGYLRKPVEASELVTQVRTRLPVPVGPAAPVAPAKPSEDSGARLVVRVPEPEEDLSESLVECDDDPKPAPVAKDRVQPRSTSIAPTPSIAPIDRQAADKRAEANARRADRLDAELERLRVQHATLTKNNGAKLANIQQEHAVALEQERATANARLAEVTRAHAEILARSHALEEELHTAHDAHDQAAVDHARTLLEYETEAARLQRERDEVLATTKRAAREALETALTASQRAKDEALAEARARAASVLATVEEAASARHRELATTRDKALHRATTVEGELRAAQVALADLGREKERCMGELETQRREHDAALASAGDFAKRLRESEEKLTAALLLNRDHEGAVARLESAHVVAVSEVRRQLEDDRKVLAETNESMRARAAEAYEERVMALRKELRATTVALAAERQRREALQNADASVPEVKGGSGAQHRAVRATMRIPTPSGWLAVGAGDPRAMLAEVLARALGSETQAELTMAAVISASRRTELPSNGDELRALIERHLLTELRGRFGEARARELVDEISMKISGRESGDAVANRRTTRPPPLDEAPVAPTTVRPPPVRESGTRLAATSRRRSVLIIDGDRASRTEVAHALARAGCEITVRDSCVGIASVVRQFDLVVTEVVGVAIEELLETFAKGVPSCTVIAWTEGVDFARSMFDAARMSRVSVLAKQPRPDALVAAVCTSIGELSAVARG